MKTVSFRAQLKGNISDFLHKEGMTCPETEEAILELVVALSHYTEEGVILFPRVILCDNLERTLTVLQGSDPLKVGTGVKEVATILQALKRCAPLSSGDWMVFIQRDATMFHYGVFRTSSSLTALDVSDTLRSLAKEANDLKIILISQLAEKAVELIGARSGVFQVYLSATPEDSPSPSEALDNLTECCTRSAPEEVKEQLASFLRKTFYYNLQHCHGTLIIIVKDIESIRPELTEDGVLFDKPIIITLLIQEYEKRQDYASTITLKAHATLLRGMLLSDGIVIMDTYGNIWGYNFFVKYSGSSGPREASLVGGARRRAYNRLCELVEQGTIFACFIQSSDGRIEFYQKR